MSDETRQERATAIAVGIATGIAKEIAVHTPKKPAIDFEVWVLRIAHAILTFPEGTKSAPVKTPAEILHEIEICAGNGDWEEGVYRDEITAMLEQLAKDGGGVTA